MIMKSAVKWRIHALLGLLVSVLIGCDSNEQVAEGPLSEDNRPELVIAGSTFAHPFFNSILETWSQDHQAIHYLYRAIGSGAGIEEFISGKADIGTTDAPLKPTESARLDEDIDEIMVTSGMISIAYHLDGINGTLKLTRDLYPDIFMGKITRWDDPRIVAANPDIELPAKHIQVVARADSSGTTFAFTNHLAAISPSWKAGLGAAKLIDWPGSTMVAKGNEGVAQKLAITKNSIGYVEFGFAQRLGLKAARLENQSGNFVLPSLTTGELGLGEAVNSSAADLLTTVSDPAGAGSYPIVAYTWALVRHQYGNADKDRAVQELMKWILNEGQALAKPLLYLPLSSAMVEQGLTKLSE